MQSIKSIYVLFVLLFLMGCGEDQETDITEITKLGLDVVAKKKDLPECDSDIEGKFVWVTAEERSYLCKDGDWLAYTEGGVPKDHSIECSTKELKDGSGVQVVCDGDSIGALRHSSGADADKEFSKCSLRMLASDSLKLTCGSMSKLLSIDELLESVGESYEVVVDSEQVAIRLENIGGYSQKGPFLTGSEVVAYEIENGRTMKQTGTKFEGRISSDDGSFNIRSVKLASQYGFVSVNGFYLNEVSGNVSNARITLNAVTDFRSRNRVNVNVLTHMEYERILYLVTKKKYRFAEAKKKAESEIWKIFRIDAEKFQNDAEDLNIAGSTDADAALLAVSIMLQRDGDSGDLLSLVTDIGNAIKEGKEWKNDSLDVAIADWALNADVSGEYEKIKKNVVNLGISLKVADFEPYLRNYWQSVLDIPACTDKNDGFVAIVQNKKSVYYSEDGAKMALRCDAHENRWVSLTDEEKDQSNWKDTLDGALKSGNVRSDVIYVFDSTGAYDGKKGWRVVTSATELSFGGCRKEVFGDTVFVEEYGRNFVCDEKSHLWKGTFAFSVIDTSAWPKNFDGDVKWSNFETTCHIFESRLGFWRETREGDCYLGLMGCTDARVGEISYSPVDKRYYECSYQSMGVSYTGSPYITTEADCKRFCDSMHVDEGPHVVCGLFKTTYLEKIMSLYPSVYEFEEDYLPKISDDMQYYTYCAVEADYPSWTSISDAKVDRYGSECKGRETFWGVLDSNNLYACKGDKMVLVNDMEKMLGQYCYEDVEGSLSRNYKYVCRYKSHYPSDVDTDWRWEIATIFDIPKGTLSYFNDELNYGTLKDPRDGKTYKTIDIEGSGTWMAENLNFRDEKNYYYLRNNISCDPKDDSECSRLGTIYSWTAAMNIDSKWWNYGPASKVEGIIKTPHQGICPDGWHIPTADEWLGLVQVFQPEISSFEKWEDIDALKFKAKNLNEWPDATNESGLSLLPSSEGYGLFCSASGGEIQVTGVFFNFPGESSGTVRCKKDDPTE